MERSPAEVSIRRHSPEPADLEQLRKDTARFTSTTESYRARNRQFEKKPGSIWSVTSRSSLAIPIFSFCIYTTTGELLQTALHYVQRCIIDLSRHPHSFFSAPCTAPDSIQKIRELYQVYLAKRSWLFCYPSGVRRCEHRRETAGARSLFLNGRTLYFILSLTAYLCSKNLTSGLVHILCPLLPPSFPPSALFTVTEWSSRSTLFPSFCPIFVCVCYLAFVIWLALWKKNTPSYSLMQFNKTNNRFRGFYTVYYDLNLGHIYFMAFVLDVICYRCLVVHLNY